VAQSTQAGGEGASSSSNGGGEEQLNAMVWGFASGLCCWVAGEVAESAHAVSFCAFREQAKL
jgi:hypothetical protein